MGAVPASALHTFMMPCSLKVLIRKHDDSGLCLVLIKPFMNRSAIIKLALANLHEAPPLCSWGRISS